MRKIELLGKLLSVKIKPDCGEFVSTESEVEPEDYRLIARIVGTAEELMITIKTPNEGGDIIVTKGTVIKATIDAGGCQLKYDGLDFTSDQYASLAKIVKNEYIALFILTPIQNDLGFDEED